MEFGVSSLEFRFIARASSAFRLGGLKSLLIPNSKLQTHQILTLEVDQ